MKEGDRVAIKGDPLERVFTVARLEQWDQWVAVVEDADRHSSKVPVSALIYVG